MLKISVEPEVGLIDVERRIVISGAKPHSEITVQSLTKRGKNDWKSQVVVKADAHGIVDLTRDAPVSGDYQGVSAMGLIWSQHHGRQETLPLFNDDLSQPLETQLSAQNGTSNAHTQLSQVLMAQGVTREDVRINGLVGTLYRAAGDNPAPAVMIMNGSGGGINEPRAALYASHGYHALALGYFGAEGLPKYISNTPLEYFEKGLDWLRETVKPKDNFVAVSGQSRGGELVLLLGATFPEKVSAVIGYVPSAFVHGGQAAADPTFGRDGPCWLYQGKSLTHIWDNNRFASWKPYDEGPQPRRNSVAMRTALADPEAMRRARIEVEKIAGPVMLISGGDDGAWPSDYYSLLVQSSLLATNHPFHVGWYNLPQAGHSILFPYVPSTQIVHTHPVSGHLSTMGGDPLHNAQANEESWRAVLQFLQKAVAEKA
ncbi:acyl-CoA thioesterase/bile acid-CoA:amino acid N-acyltransferase family protein [Brucellaceae bacterium C25G]